MQCAFPSVGMQQQAGSRRLWPPKGIGPTHAASSGSGWPREFRATLRQAAHCRDTDRQGHLKHRSTKLFTLHLTLSKRESDLARQPSPHLDCITAGALPASAAEHLQKHVGVFRLHSSDNLRAGGVRGAATCPQNHNRDDNIRDSMHRPCAGRV